MQTSNNNVETYVELRYFPVKVTEEYVNSLPDYCIYYLYMAFIRDTGQYVIYPPRDITVNNLFAYIERIYYYQHHAPTVTKFIKELKELLIEYYNKERIYSNMRYFL